MWLDYVLQFCYSVFQGLGFTNGTPAGSIWEVRKVQRGMRYAGLYLLFSGLTYFYTNIRFESHRLSSCLFLCIWRTSELCIYCDSLIRVYGFFELSFPERVYPGVKVQNNEIARFFCVFTWVGFLDAWVRNAWWIWCSTRSGVPRMNQPYSLYPAGTDILFDATEVSYNCLLRHLQYPSDFVLPLRFRVFEVPFFVVARGGCEIEALRMHWLVWGVLKIVVALKRPSSFRGPWSPCLPHISNLRIHYQHWVLWINAFKHRAAILFFVFYSF